MGDHDEVLGGSWEEPGKVGYGRSGESGEEQVTGGYGRVRKRGGGYER